MRILIINPIVGYLSTGRTVFELDRFFKKEGHSSFVAAIHGFGPSNIYYIGSKLDRKIHAFMSRLTGYEAHFSTLPTKKLIKYIENIKPDVIYLGIAHSNYINLFLLLDYIAKKDIPTCVVLNDCWHFTGKCMHFTSNKCYKWKEGCGNCPHLQAGLPTWFFDRTEYLIKKKKTAFGKIPRLAVVGVSDWLTNIAKESILKDAKIIRRIYNSIDTNVFCPKETSELRKKYNIQDKFVILGVASCFDESKGLTSWLSLARDVGDDTQIVMVGKIENGTLPENIIHIPRIDDKEKLSLLYSMADVLVTFSKEETFGKVSAEALACGVPVICYDQTANPELIGERCGIVVPAGDYEAVLDAIEKVKKLTKNYYKPYCVSFANQNFKLEKSGREYLQLFEELMGK